MNQTSVAEVNHKITRLLVDGVECGATMIQRLRNIGDEGGAVRSAAHLKGRKGIW